MIMQEKDKMAERKIYVPKIKCAGVDEISVEFKWNLGLSIVQKQKNIQALHKAAFKKKNISSILEISSKSTNKEGILLSAFNLSFLTNERKSLTVESAFQGSKTFEFGGPYTDIYTKTSKESKKDERLKKSGKLICFTFFNEIFELNPATFFYDWLYINALNKNENLHQFVLNYEAFTDIEFNPAKSWNCQAYSVALYVSLYKNNLLKEALKSKDNFKKIVKAEYDRKETILQKQKSFL